MSESTRYNWKDKLFLIVEDDPASSMLLEIILSKTGAKLLFAESGEKAIEVVKRTRGIDIILLDIKMSGISGLQAAVLIKGISPSIPIIAQTACVVYGDKERCLQAGCSGYIPKPIIADNLLEIIQNQFSQSIEKEVYRDPFCSN
ncbi:MAG: response regulator [Bacteroidales bacterium]|nr:MAG: response regulator [Bacteroidales bacterium]